MFPRGGGKGEGGGEESQPMVLRHLAFFFHPFDSYIIILANFDTKI